MKALEVSIDGKVVGIPHEGQSFAAMLGNVPLTYMRAHVVSHNEAESWQWQLPDVQEGQLVSFRMVEAVPGSGVPPQLVRSRDPREVDDIKRKAQEAYARAKREGGSKG